MNRKQVVELHALIHCHWYTLELIYFFIFRAQLITNEYANRKVFSTDSSLKSVIH